MTPSITFSPSPGIRDLDMKRSSIKCSQQFTTANLRMDLNNNNNSVIILDEKGATQKFSKISKVKGYFIQIALFVLELFVTLFCYLFGLALLFNVFLAAGFSWLLRLAVKLTFATCYSRRYKLIERGADALWAVETGFGASSSNIVIGLTCKGDPSLDKVISTFETKVLNFKTRLRVKKVDGSYVQEETGSVYEPYQNLKWIVVEKFLFYCMKKDGGFNIRNHFSVEEYEHGNLTDNMRSTMEACITTRMSRDLPQWRFRIVTQKQQEEYGLVFTIHHSYGDAISWVQMFRYAFADNPVKASIDPMGKSPSLSSHYFSSSEPLATRTLRWIQTVVLFPHYFARQMAYILRETNFFHGPFVKNKGTCQWNSLKMTEIKAIRIPKSTTPLIEQSGGKHTSIMITGGGSSKPAFTALLSACITSAFTKLFRDYKARVPGKILAILPYADLPYRTLHPLNNFYSHVLPIPTSVTNSRARLIKCDKYTKSFNPPPTKPVNTLIAHLCGIMMSPLQKLVGLSARSTVGFSNVPGPAERIHLFGGDEVTSLILFPPLKFRTSIVVGFISYGEQLTMSICVDDTIPNHSVFAARFMEYFQEELETLVELSRPQIRDVVVPPCEEAVHDINRPVVTIGESCNTMDIQTEVTLCSGSDENEASKDRLYIGELECFPAVVVPSSCTLENATSLCNSDNVAISNTNSFRDNS